MNDFSIEGLPLFDRPQPPPPIRFVIDEEKVRDSAKIVLDLLLDREWHTTNEILGLYKVSHRFSTSVEYLREHGWEIETQLIEKHSFRYKLHGKVSVISGKKQLAMLQEQYYQTWHWYETRMERLDLDSFRCCICKDTEQLQVHHWKYELFDEKIKDLMTMCEDCHDKIHSNPAIKISFPKSLPVSTANQIEMAEPYSWEDDIERD